MKIMVLISVIFIFLSCSSQVSLLKPQGETVSLEFDETAQYQGELFAVNDTTFIFCHRDNLYEIPFSNVVNVYIHDYSVKKLKMIGSIGAMSFYTLLPLMSMSLNTELLISIVTMDALIVLSYFVENPKVNFSHPLSGKDLHKLQLYSRYSYGLNSEQWKLLLQNYKQDEFFGLSQLRK